MKESASLKGSIDKNTPEENMKGIGHLLILTFNTRKIRGRTIQSEDGKSR